MGQMEKTNSEFQLRTGWFGGERGELYERPLFLLSMIVFAAIGAVFSGAVHEAGHILVGRFAGLKIIDYQLWFMLGRAHVTFSGSMSSGWHAAFNIAGVLASVSAGILGMVLLRVLVAAQPKMIVCAFAFIPMLSQSLTWMVLPAVLALGGTAPREDVTKFIANSGWSYAAVTIVGLILVAASTFVSIETYRGWRKACHARADTSGER